MGVGPPPHPAHQPGPAGTGGAPGDPERRLCRQGGGEAQLHHQVHRGHQEGETAKRRRRRLAGSALKGEALSFFSSCIFRLLTVLFVSTSLLLLLLQHVALQPGFGLHPIREKATWPCRLISRHFPCVLHQLLLPLQPKLG